MVPDFVCSRCRRPIAEAPTAAVVTIQPIGGRETRRVLCATCARAALAALQGGYEPTGAGGKE